MVHIPNLRSELNRSLGELVPCVHEEADVVFETEFPLDVNGAYIQIPLTLLESSCFDSTRLSVIRCIPNSCENDSKDKQPCSSWIAPL
jgi:hypothetical protein